MSAWLAGIISSIVEKLVQTLGNDLVNWLKDVFAKWQRAANQAKTAQQVQEDQGKPRSPEVDQHEADDINS